MTVTVAAPASTAIAPVRSGVFFTLPEGDLPRGRHALDRDAVRLIQRERLMAALCELVAARGLDGVKITHVVAHTGVSRSAFYDCFSDLAACADAAYERFIEVLLHRLIETMDPRAGWHEFVRSTIASYLQALQADPVVARALQLEMDAAGRQARTRRRGALQKIADAIAARHELLRRQDASVGPLPDEAHLGIVYAVRQLACDALDDDPDADLSRLIEPAVRWVAAAVAGARLAAEQAPTGSDGPLPPSDHQ